jgi:hypothetical protein
MTLLSSDGRELRRQYWETELQGQDSQSLLPATLSGLRDNK